MNRKRIFLFGFSLFIPSFVHATVSVTVEGDHAFLRGPSCEVLKDQIQGLATWKKKLNERATVPVCQCPEVRSEAKASADTACKVQIDGVLPWFVKSALKETKKCVGPNCWNAALVASKILPHKTHTSESEMEFWSRSPLCTERKADEEPEPGDLILIRQNDDARTGVEVHGGVIVPPHLVFSTDTPRPDSPYEFKTLEAVLKQFKVTDSKCHQVTGKKAGCYRYVNFFKCSPLVASKHLFDGDASEACDRYRATLREIQRTECELSQVLFSGPKVTCSAETLKNLEALVTEVNEVVPSLPKNQPMSAFKSGVAINRMRSLLKQVVHLGEQRISLSMSELATIEKRLGDTSKPFAEGDRKALIRQRTQLVNEVQAVKDNKEKVQRLFSSFTSMHGEDVSGVECKSAGNDDKNSSSDKPSLETISCDMMSLMSCTSKPQ